MDIAISAKIAKITAVLGINVLNIIKITIDIKTKEIIIADTELTIDYGEYYGESF